MKTKLTLIILAVMPLFLNAQPIDDGWFEVGNSNYNATLESIHYIDENTGFAVGSGGAFLKTTDGGFNWIAYDIGHDYHFKEIVFTDSDTGFLFGIIRLGPNNRTTLLKSTDGGDTWDIVLGPEGIAEVRDISFPHDFNTNNTAYFLTAGTNNLYQTTDGGNTWNNLNISKSFNRMQFFDQSKGIATYWGAGNPSLAITNDGGQTWTDVEIEGLGQGRAFFVVNDTVGYVSSINSVSYTTDAGETWSTPVIVSNTDWRATKLHFSSETAGYRFDNSGVIFKTTDSGENWTEFYNDPKYPANSIFTRTSGNVDFVSSGGASFTSDGTNPFVMRTSGIMNGSLHNVWFFNEEQGITVGDNGTVLKTENNGTSWNNYNSGVDYRLTALYFTSEDVGYTSGERNIRKTVDGGENWSSSSSGINYIPVNSVFFTSETTGYTTGSRTFKTTNGGDNWTEIHDLYGHKIFFADENTGYIISGSGGVMRKTTDAGANWTELSTGISNHLRGIYFHSPDIGIVAGGHANIYKTTDGGENWSHVHDGPSGILINDIDFIDENLGYALGIQGFIARTEDGGDTWQQVNSNTIRDLNAIYITPDGTPFVVGQDGIVLRKVPSHTLTFNVTDTEANPIDDAVVTFNGVPYSAGHYVFPGLIPDDYTYSVTKAGYSVASGTVTIVDEDVTIDIALEPSYKATFSVTGSHHGNPLEGAQILIDGVGSILTNASGVAVFENLFPADDYAYEITADHYMMAESTFEIVNADIVIQISMDADLDAPLATEATLITPFGFTANWEAVAEADNYLLYVSDDDFENHLIDGQVVTGTNYVIESAGPDTEYKYRLKAANPHGVSSFSNSITVTTLAPPAPDAPVALEATGIIQTAFTAHWQAADNADGYLLFVSEDDFTTHLEGYHGLEVTALEHDITDLQPETTYQYRLKAYSEDGESDYSNIIEVTTEALVIPDAPVALDATDITQTGFTAHWQAADNADGYLLFVSEDDFATHLEGYNGLEVTALEQDITGLQPETSYQYRLKAYNEDGESEYSNIIEVTTEPLVIPDAPVALEATGITQTAFTANWQAADNADGYLLYVSQDDFATHLEGYNGLEVTALEQAITGLQPETSYQYRLKAYNEDGESEFSNIIEVITEDTSTSINIFSEAKISIFPNPAQNHLFIEGVEPNSTIDVFSITGSKLMRLENQSGSVNLDVSGLGSGVYIIKINAANKSVSKKIFINR